MKGILRLAPSHGSAESTSMHLIDTLKPASVIVTNSVGKGKRYCHPGMSQSGYLGSVQNTKSPFT